MEILKKEMLLAGEDSQTLSEKLGVAPSTVIGWVNGTFKPKAKSVVKLQKLGFSEQACLFPSKEIEI